ncbi:MAG TPA: KH domain-containing protein [Methanomassiliicoccales archaeon]|nr:KH domain-containing protein [Methanomassiliicoccales archaeon]
MSMLRIPMDRVGSLIGKGGETKKMIEDRTKTIIKVDPEGEVRIYNRGSEDPLIVVKVTDLIRAVGRGFSPERALRLLDDDEYFEVIDIRDYVGKKSSHVIRMRARIIGTNGKTRRLIEDLTGAFISIYGSSVSIIGNSIQMPIVRNAVDMLLRGSEHSTVYKYMERQRGRLRISEMGFE